MKIAIPDSGLATRAGPRATVHATVGQYGTHIDPPAHFAPDGATMDRIPLKQMILPLVVIDETPPLGADPAHALTVADVEAWEQQHGRIPPVSGLVAAGHPFRLRTA